MTQTDRTSRPAGKRGGRKPKYTKRRQKHSRGDKKREIQTRRAFMRAMRAFHKMSDKAKQVGPPVDGA